jgi:hypothetical protein
MADMPLMGDDSASAMELSMKHQARLGNANFLPRQLPLFRESKSLIMERILIQAAPRLVHDPSFATVISSAAPDSVSP